MRLDEQLTVIPFSAAALDAVTTPFVAFEQPFESCPGRFERQIEMMKYGTSVVILCDVWPSAICDPVSYGDGIKMLRNFGKPHHKYERTFWPETALFQTDVLRYNVTIDETVKYRPCMWLLGKFNFRPEGPLAYFDVGFLPDAAIKVNDRSIYPLEYPRLTLVKETTRKLSIIVFREPGEPGCPSVEEIGLGCPEDTEILLPVGSTFGEVFNNGMEAATGEFVALHRIGTRTTEDRFSRQLDVDMDMSFGPVILGDENTALSTSHIWHIRGFEQRAAPVNACLGTLMFRRSIFNEIPGAHPDLHDGFEYDLMVRIAHDTRFNVLQFNHPMGYRSERNPKHGVMYTQHVYNDAASRISYGEDHHAWSVVI